MCEYVPVNNQREASMDMGEKVKEYRLRNARSQEQLAELASLSVRTVQRIENGHKPGLETLSALASVFNVNVAELSGNMTQAEETLDTRISEAGGFAWNRKRVFIVRSLLPCLSVAC